MLNWNFDFIYEKIKGLHLKNTTGLYSAMLINVALGYVVTKINTNYLLVSEYGMYSLFLNTILFSRVFFSFGLFEATSRILAIEEDKNKAREIYGTNLILTFFSGLGLSITILIISSIFDLVFNIKIGFLLLLFFPVVLGILLQAMLQTILRGFNYIRLLSVFTVSPRIFYVVGMIILVTLGQFTLKNTLGVHLLTVLFVSLFFALAVKPSFKNLKKRLLLIKKEIKIFGSHLYLANIFMAFSYHSDKLILAYFLDAQQLAYYALAFALTAPIPYFSVALSTSAYKNFANYDKIPKRHLYINLIFISATSLILIILKEFIILELFSINFMASISSFVVLTIAFALNALSVPYTMFFKAQRKGKEIRNITFIVQVVFVALNIILIPIIGIIGAALAALIGFGLDYLLYLIKYYRMFIKK